jgi:hypothetical protein
MANNATVALCMFAAAFLAGSAVAAQPPPDNGGKQPASPPPAATMVGLVCSWSAFSQVEESILIDLKKRSAYWVNQNQTLKVLQLNAGRVVLAGIRDRLRISSSKIKTKVAVRMAIDRISGAFVMEQNAYPAQGPGTCRRQRLF